MYIVLLSLFFTMTPYLLHGRWWQTVYPPAYSIVTTRKGVCPYQYIVCLRSCISSVVQRDPPVVRLSNSSSHGFTWVLHQNGDIHLGVLFYLECNTTPHDHRWELPGN